jgi:sugar (pentulose or hexulose) kinase
VWRATHRYLLLSGYLTWRLTGRWADSVGCQVGYLPFDFRRLRWAGGRDWRWDAFGIDPALLPELVAPGTVIGTLTAAAAAALGVPRDTPLVAAAADKACEILGAGATRPGTAAISYGTTATVNVLLDRYAEAIPFMPAYPGPVPGRHALEVQIARGYWLVRWLLREFGAHEGRLAEAEGVRPEVLFDRLVGEVPPGARGLLLQPYWSPGVREPGPEARGAVIGFGAEHGRAHVYRALLEGLAYGLREGAERIARGARVSVRALCVAGGGAQSDVVLQLTADVFGRPASRPHLGDASALGAAIAAAVGAGLHPDFDAAVARMTRLVRTFEPDARAARMYDRLYERVYRKMYARLQPLYAELHRLADRDD